MHFYLSIKSKCLHWPCWFIVINTIIENMRQNHIVNAFTLSRIPVAGLFYYIISENYFNLLPVLFICFAYIELSDLMDGYLARKFNIVSNVGKILDPAADVTSHFLCILAFDHKNLIPELVIVVFVLREYWILLLRSQLIRMNFVLQARFSGKIKTVFYAISIFATLLFYPNGIFSPYLLLYKPVLNWLWYIATIFSIVSALHYSIIAWVKFRGQVAISTNAFDERDIFKNK